MKDAGPAPGTTGVIYSAAQTATGPPKRHLRGWRDTKDNTELCPGPLGLSRALLACSPRPNSRQRAGHAPTLAASFTPASTSRFEIEASALAPDHAARCCVTGKAIAMPRSYDPEHDPLAQSVS